MVVPNLDLEHLEQHLINQMEKDPEFNKQYPKVEAAKQGEGSFLNETSSVP